MIFHNYFQNKINEINQRKKNDATLQNGLHLYNGRNVLIMVSDDNKYRLNISTKGVSLEASPDLLPDDLYIQTDSQIINNFVSGTYSGLGGNFQLLQLLNTGRIQTNLNMNDINFIREFL